MQIAQEVIRQAAELHGADVVQDRNVHNLMKNFEDEVSGYLRNREIAEWLGALSGGIYLPFEIYEIARHITLVRVSLFALNVAMVAYLARLLWLRRRAAEVLQVPRPCAMRSWRSAASSM